MSKRFVVALPRIETPSPWPDVLAARDRYDPLARTLPPHLTLVFPFDDPMSDQALREHVASVVSALPPFEVTMCGITAHENEYLFLNVKRGNDQLIELHDRLYEGTLARHLVRMNTFVPHITVGRLPPQELAAALEATADLNRPIEAHVDALSIYRIEPQGDRQIFAQIPLRVAP